jgi:phage recombination protein Bet
MPNELDVTRSFEIVITAEQKELVKKTVFPDATDAELQLFFFDCTRRGIHPLDKLIHPTKRNGKYTPITSIDLFRQRASESGEHMGTDDAVYTGDAGQKDFAASVTVYKHLRGEKCAFTATARWSEYCPPAGSDFMWRKMPHLMLAKCAEALVLRKAFPQQLHGLYTNEEMAQAGPPLPMTPLNIPQIRPKQDATMVQPGKQEDGAGTTQATEKARPVVEPTAQQTSDAPAPSAADYCKQQAEGMSDSPIFTFGKHKGKTPYDKAVPDDYLAWIEPMLAKQVDDPSKARYAAVNQALLDAVRGAAVDRGMIQYDK